MHDAGTQPDPARDNGRETIPSGPKRRKSRTGSRGNRKSSRESKKLEKMRTYSFTPGRDDGIIVRGDADRPPVPPLPPHLIGKVEKQLRSYTQPPESTQDWQRVPTLHKRSAQEMSRRKSSKKRKEEHNREAEIKAMSANVPIRAATDAGLSGRPMKRESKTMRRGLSRALHNPSSDISLPTAESIRSSLSSDAEQTTSYKVSPFHLLSPRPTIRHTGNPRYTSGASLSSDNPESQKRKVSDRVTISQEILKANKRVDELADDLSAGELRQLMERDQKRRDRKKIADKIKIEKKIAQRQEKQREDEANAERAGTPPPANMERGVLGREVAGLGIGTSAIVTSSKRKGSVGSESRRGKRPAEIFTSESTASAHGRINLRPRSDKTSPKSDQPATSVTEDAQIRTLVTSNVRPTTPPMAETDTKGSSSTLQKSDLGNSDALTTRVSLVPVAARASDQPTNPTLEDSSRSPQTWTSFFKRSPKPKRPPAPPSSFSNTSRDSMQNGQGPQIGYIPVKTTSNLPKRTMSKFREDLPDFPMSPPISRMQSPEADIVPTIRKEYADKRSGPRASSDDPHMRYDTPTSGYRSLDTGRVRDETSNSGDRLIDVPSPEPAALLSQSLASIDSEGSWLSGRKSSKRGSAQLSSYPLRDSASSLHRKYQSFTESTEELGIAEDEYFTRLTPGPENKRQSAGNPMPSSDEEDGDSLTSPVEAGKAKWGAVARHPTVVHREPRAKSREGLLNYFEFDSGSEAPGEAPLDVDRDSKDSGESDIRVHRATSVDLGIKHARHISAGSARLLELKGRTSGDANRLSLGSDLG
jgi:hypothetical protein